MSKVVGEVSKMSGEYVVQSADGTIKILAVGSLIYEDDTILGRNGLELEVALSHGDILQLEGNAIARLSDVVTSDTPVATTDVTIDSNELLNGVDEGLFYLENFDTAAPLSIQEETVNNINTIADVIRETDLVSSEPLIPISEVIVTEEPQTMVENDVVTATSKEDSLVAQALAKAAMDVYEENAAVALAAVDTVNTVLASANDAIAALENNHSAENIAAVEAAKEMALHVAQTAMDAAESALQAYNDAIAAGNDGLIDQTAVTNAMDAARYASEIALTLESASDAIVAAAEELSASTLSAASTEASAAEAAHRLASTQASATDLAQSAAHSALSSLTEDPTTGQAAE
ncbi:MAG: hypothetical protein PHW64_02625, partial [Sulfuricurvum sp.]|nr:hypothetical protein [Sulfuricurvum sp.]